MSGGFGNTPWGSGFGGQSLDGGSSTPESIPTSSTWDTFDLSGVRQADDLERVLDFVEVSTSGDGSSFFPGSFNVASGGAYTSATAALLIDVDVGETFTINYEVNFKALPEDFSEVVQGAPAGRHVLLSVWSGQDFAAGFFVSKQGFAYTGEVSFSGINVVPAQSVTVLAGSDAWVEENKVYVIRVVLDSEKGLVYLYVSPKTEPFSGLELKAILAARPTSISTSDNTIISCRGTNSDPVWVELLNYQLSSKLVLPDLPVVADAGDDKAAPSCSIVQLDGSRSYDPDGTPITYEWRMVDAPVDSAFVVQCGDGETLSESPTVGFTDEFYSDELAAVDAEDPIDLLDVLVLGNGAYTIVQIVRSPTFYVRVEYKQLPELRTGLQFRVVRQRGIEGRDKAKPTFYPDKTGFYVFDLRVFSGFTSSSPLGTDRSRVYVNVVENALAYGAAPDTTFIFDNLLSFWKQVEDRDKITAFWEGLARVAATELYTLWQLEYSKSLRDVQRTFNRRWLHYDMLLPEPVPELTAIRYLWGGITSNALSPSGVAGVSGTQIVVSSPFLDDVVVIPLIGQGTVPLTAYAQELKARLSEILGPSVRTSFWRSRAELISSPISGVTYPTSFQGRTLVVTVDGGAPVTATASAVSSLEQLVESLASQLPSASVTATSTGALRVGSRTVSGSSVAIDAASTLLAANGGPLVFSQSSATSTTRLHVDANIPFTLTTLSSAPGFSYPQMNGLVGAAVGGERVGERVFRASRPLGDLPLKEDDLLVIDRTAYRVVRVVDDVNDTFEAQRVIVKEALPATGTGVEWIIPGWVQSEFLDFWKGLVDRGDHLDFELTIPKGDQSVSMLVPTTALGACEALPGRLAINSAELAAQLSLEVGTTVRLARVVRRRYVPIDPLVLSVPRLTEVIDVEDDDPVLRENVDYFRETIRGQNALRFSSGASGDSGDVWEGTRPPFRLWAEHTLVDNEPLIEANFGSVIGLTRDRVPDTVDYLSAVRGLYYARYNGPTVRNLRIALQIFLGLPFAEEPGTIVEIRTDLGTQRGRILVRDTENSRIVRSYTFPRTLTLEVNPATGKVYEVGDAVEQFAPLVSGVEVIDWINNPTWFAGLIAQGAFYEPQKYHTFMVRVSSDAFSLQSLLFAQSFVQSAKPKHTDPFYVVNLVPSRDGDEIDVIDTIEMNLKLSLYDTPCHRLGASYHFDEPWPAGAAYGASWRNSFDTDDDPNTPAPVYPGSPDEVGWAFDKEMLCPEDQVEALVNETYDGVELAAFDSIFYFDVDTTRYFEQTAAGAASYTATFAVTNAPFDTKVLRYNVLLSGDTGTVTETDWVAELLVNGVVQHTHAFSLGHVHPVNGLVLTMKHDIELVADGLDVTASNGQSIAVRIRPVAVVAQTPSWTQVTCSVLLSAGPWYFDVAPPAGTYNVYKELS